MSEIRVGASAALLSVTMAVGALEEQARKTADARAAYERERALRDELIRDARRVRVPVTALMASTGLSRDRLYKVAATGGTR